MKVGFRKPNLNKRLIAMTKGRLTRVLRGLINPFYGKRGMGWLNPEKKLYNHIYYRITKKLF